MVLIGLVGIVFVFAVYQHYQGKQRVMAENKSVKLKAQVNVLEMVFLTVFIGLLLWFGFNGDAEAWDPNLQMGTMGLAGLILLIAFLNLILPTYLLSEGIQRPFRFIKSKDIEEVEIDAEEEPIMVSMWVPQPGKMIYGLRLSQGASIERWRRTRQTYLLAEADEIDIVRRRLPKRGRRR
ncbi:MAG TPA: hypothetical protein VLL52_05485 [Anaerolineae bacterium]|nr:hypothetical protein [Anaerolineae bacterium]